MTGDDKLLGLIDLIYEAVLDNDLWPFVLVKIADVVGLPQIGMPSYDWRSNVYTTFAPRFDPELLAAYSAHWAFEEPIVPRAMMRPPGQVYMLDHLMPAQEFAATPVFNEWWQKAGCGLTSMGANVVAEDRFTALVALWNPPGGEAIESSQIRLFKALLPHIGRAVRINRKHHYLELKNIAATEGFETSQEGAILADASARVVVANPIAKAILDARDGIFLRDGRLTVNGIAEALQHLIVSCARGVITKGAPGGELTVPRGLGKAPLRITVTPLRSKVRLLDCPWIGVGSPVAIVTLRDRDLDRRRREKGLRRRFGLTSAEAALAAEIMQGDGRKAAAVRCGISDETAKSHLKNIFDKTGTRRQAELVRLLVDRARDTEPG